MQEVGHPLGRRGCLFIVSGPSGAGKTSICTPVLRQLAGIELSISFTTRKPRAGERDGVDYRFVDAATFAAMATRGEFAEWAEVHRNRYGTSKAAIETALEEGRDLILDIDVQGAAQIKRAYPEAVSVFLLPPSMERLRERLVGRNTDDSDSVRTRMENACSEIAAVDRYDYAIVNEALDVAVEGMLAVVRAERLRVQRIRAAELERLLREFEALP